MVLQKRLEYGFNGYQVPATPRAARSARRRSAFKKNGQGNQVSAFDLLAAVAGKLLLEGGNSSASSNNISADVDQHAVTESTVKKEPHDENQPPVKVEICDQGNNNRGFFVSEIIPNALENQCCKESPSPPHDANFGATSVIAGSDSLDRCDSQEVANGKTKSEMGSVAGYVNKPKHGDEMYIDDKPNDVGKSLGDVLVKDERPPTVGSLGSSEEMAVCGDLIPQNSVPITQDNINLVSRDDDDENLSGCTQISNPKKSFRSTPRIGDRRIRKILASKYWKVSSKPKDLTLSDTDLDLKPGYCARKNYLKCLRSEKNYPIKKRRFLNCLSVFNSDDISSEEISGSPQKGIVRNDSKMQKASTVSSSVTGQQSSFQSRESHVKLRIKSFRVPELFIEIPETATVGSLKRTVLEAVTAILGGGLRVGVLVQGKRVRDDNKTLLQTGISQDSQSEALGFCLEPNPSQTPSSLCSGDSRLSLPCNAPQPLTRYLPVASNNDTFAKPNGSNTGHVVESDHDLAPPPPDASVDKSMDFSRALVPAAPLRAEAITVIPSRKSKRSEVAQRRIRRPFSVAEVEALVQAVEKLGTGRWRDVKLRAFENAKHRTYVDLKDKWKTLVHTARISPQQRRGEPVPQELLDRVLTAHAYWSQHQAKQQQLRQPAPPHQQRSETSLVL